MGLHRAALKHQAGVHVHYQETVFPIVDGALKMKDLPAEMGGSGVLLQERASA